ncbi:GNAT family N-acetyltransferase [Sphingomonas sp. So64.6b]|uniref:GNAT family N-acetyltransferase n=1 Tax=Sphingomonas sp. So64.6b TaxID=2997354 RepID=UPI001602E921|nr:GNAT family N-acetyltransferase [Sphingomonas sp. So64.6b]QNA84851.1 GNAT family N-acetyltransferase [Sphingomonas sp. So64.6b]
MTQRPSRGELRIAQLSVAEGPAFDGFYEIFCDALPASERKTREQIAALATRPDYRILIGEIDDQVMSFAVLFLSDRQPMALLEYLGTSVAARGRGLGAEMFRAVLDRIGSHSLVIEVDSDRQDSSDLEMRRRRKQFYVRLGARQVTGVEYRMPRIGADSPPELDLMIWPGEGRTQVMRGEVTAWIEDIYRGAYDRAVPDDELAKMIDAMPSHVDLIR